VSTRSELSLLLLDDTVALADLYKRQLESAGPFRVVIESDGRRARRRAENQLFDLIVIDAKLTYRGIDLGGLRLADDLRPRYGGNSIVIISRFITAEFVRERELDHEFMEKHEEAGGKRFAGALGDRLKSMRAQQYAFVAMPFDNHYDDVYEKAIRPAIRKAGLECVRANEVPHNRNIPSVVSELVNRSKLVVFVADGGNANAYYEAGFADAMGKEVIIVANTEERLRIDVSSRHTIRYGSGRELRAALTDKIVALRLQRPPGYAGA
jgi:CheY-like chemotaxis protein